MEFKDKVKSRRLELGLTLEELAKLVGVSTPTIQRYETGEIANVRRDKIKLLADALKIEPSYLMGWDENNKKKVATTNSVRIPVLGKVAAGIPINAIVDIEDYEEIHKDMADRAEYFALRIHGESMEPKFSDGDVVIVRRQDDVESGEISVVIVDGTDATVKRVMKQENGIMLVATNQSVFPPKFYDNKAIEELPVRIIGKVVELRAKF